MTEEINNELSDRIEKFRKESNLGQNKEIIIEWDNQINKELSELKKYRQDYQ